MYLYELQTLEYIEKENFHNVFYEIPLSVQKKIQDV